MANLYGQTTRLDYQTDRILDWSDILLDRHTTSLTEKKLMFYYYDRLPDDTRYKGQTFRYDRTNLR